MFLRPRLNLGRRKRSALGLPGQFFDYNPVEGGAVPGTSTFARADARHYWDGTQFVSAASGVIRDEHISLVTGVKGFLWEPAATNLVEESDLTNTGTWAQQRITCASEGSVLGTLTQYRITEDVTTNSHRLFYVEGTTGDKVNFIICKEDITNSKRWIALLVGTSGSNDYVIIDPATGIVTDTGISITATKTYTLVSGWFLVAMHRAASSGNTITIGLSDSATPGTAFPNYTGDNLSSVLVAHYQSEATNYFTMPILSSGTPASKVADSFTDTTWPSTSAAIVDVSVDGFMVTQQNMLGFGSAATNFVAVDGASSARLKSGGINTAITPGTAYQYERHGFGMSLVNNEGIIVDDEDNDATDLTGTIGQGTIYIGSASDLSGQPCVIHRARIGNETQTAAELKAFL